MSNVKETPVSELEVHPFNLEVYGEPDAGLAENIDNFGLQTPIKVDPEGRILSGARRWTAVKELGWETIPAEVPDVDWSEDRDVQLYVLVANAYRKQKPTIVQKREADHYMRLLGEGAITKEELSDKVEHAGCSRSKDHPQALAAQASGMSTKTYSAWQFVHGGPRFHGGRGGSTYLGDHEPEMERQIKKALESDNLSIDQAKKLRSELQKAQQATESGAGIISTTDRLRRSLREAKKEHTLTAEQKTVREAEEAVEEVRDKGRAYVSALERLFMDHREHLDADMALNLASTFREVRGILEDQMTGGLLTDGADPVKAEPEAMEVGSEVVG